MAHLAAVLARIPSPTGTRASARLRPACRSNRYTARAAMTVGMAQPHKGERKMIQSTRVPVDVADAVDAAVSQYGHGIHRSDFLLHALCVVLDLPQHDPLAQNHPEEQMQMTA